MHEVCFTFSLIWCYCDILEPSVKTNLTCLICLQLWLVETNTRASEGGFLKASQRSRSYCEKPDFK